MADELLDQIELTEIRHGAGLDFLARLAGLLCEKSIIEPNEVDDLLDELKPESNPARSANDRQRTLCYVSALERIRAHLRPGKYEVVTPVTTDGL